MFKRKATFVYLVCLLLLVACGGTNNTEPTPLPATATEGVAQLVNTATLEPSLTPTVGPTETATPEPTETPTSVPTNTPEPTATKVVGTPTRPRPTPVPTRENRDEATPETGDAAAYPNGNDLLGRARLNTNALESVRIKQVLVVEISDTGSVSINITCDVRLVDFYCLMETTTDLGIGEPTVQIIEMVRLAEQTWLRQDNNEWLELTPEQAATLSVESIISPPLNSATYEAEVTDETTLDGHSVYEVTLTFDEASVLDVLLSQNATLPAGTDMEVIETTSTIWVGQDDQLLYRQSISLDYLVDGQPFNMTTQLSYSLHNEPVEIPDPTTE